MKGFFKMNFVKLSLVNSRTGADAGEVWFNMDRVLMMRSITERACDADGMWKVPAQHFDCTELHLVGGDYRTSPLHVRESPGTIASPNLTRRW
jgi:hypothetical protein